MLMIRLQRVGRKHEPVFRLVLTDSKNGPKSGKFLEILGNFDMRRVEKAQFDESRVKYWQSQGAQLSATVHNFLIDRKVISGKKINKLPKKSPIKKESDTDTPVAPVANPDASRTQTEQTEIPVEVASEVVTPKEESVLNTDNVGIAETETV